jgi:hypothetical protein
MITNRLVEMSQHSHRVSSRESFPICSIHFDNTYSGLCWRLTPARVKEIRGLTHGTTVVGQGTLDGPIMMDAIGRRAAVRNKPYFVPNIQIRLFTFYSSHVGAA